jgi:hypothetical protein
MAVHYVAACICRDVIVCSFACQHMCEWKCSLGIVTACRVSIHLTPWPVTHNINWWWPFYLLFPTPSLFLFFSPTTTLFKAPHLRLYPFLCLASCARPHFSSVGQTLLQNRENQSKRIFSNQPVRSMWARSVRLNADHQSCVGYLPYLPCQYST